MAQYDTAGNIVNLAASEVGLTAVADPFSSADPAFVQLCQILTSSGRELYALFKWNKLIKIYTRTMLSTDSGKYNLPADFGYMIDQTNWNPTNRLPMGGPLSPQDWQYLINTGLATNTIYVSFRVADGQLWILPLPPPNNSVITFEYISRNWVLDVDGTTEKDKVGNTNDTVWYESILITKLLKLRFLEAKGFDSTAALAQFTNQFTAWTGQDVSAQTLNMARMRVFPYLGWRNVPETNYGLP